MSTFLLCLLAAVVASAIIWKGSELLESASERLSAYYKLPPVVQGAIVVAVGSCFPELSTTVISTLVHGEFELGVCAIVGSAIFNILVNELTNFLNWTDSVFGWNWHALAFAVMRWIDSSWKPGA